MSAERRKRTDRDREHAAQAAVRNEGHADGRAENGGRVATAPDRPDSLSNQARGTIAPETSLLGSITVDRFNRETSLGLLRLADVLFPDDGKVQLKQCDQEARGREKKKPDES